MNIYCSFILFLTLLNFQGISVYGQDNSNETLKTFYAHQDAIEHSRQKLRQTLRELSYDPELHPAHINRDTGNWQVYNRKEWTSGFFAGNLWLMYKLTGETEWKKYAQLWTDDMKPMASETYDHDTGFRIFGSFGNGFLLTGDFEYQNVISQGAFSLVKRYNPEIGAIKSWDPWESLNANYPVIIDNMMNLELLFLASKHSERDEWQDIAVKHARTTLDHHFRKNGSTYHIVDFDDRGGVVRKFTTQGYNDDSSWTRGQAWSIYGFTMSYRYTRLPEFLNAAVSAADYFIEHLPKDRIPPYDFLTSSHSNTTKDASAAAIAASALFELYSFTDNTLYFNTAVEIIDALFSENYSTLNSDESSILTRSTRQRGDSERGTIYADYYFLEAIVRYRQQIGSPFPVITPKHGFYLQQNYPNPFNSQTQFHYTVEEPGYVEVNLYDLSGRKVQTLFNGQREPGAYPVRLNADNYSSGFYIYTLRANDQLQTRKMLLIK